PASTATISDGFAVFLETRPPGAQILAGTLFLGTTPARVTLDRDQIVRLHKSGYRDEELPLSRGTEHVIVPLERAASAARPAHKTPKPAPTEPASDGTGLGLND